MGCYGSWLTAGRPTQGSKSRELNLCAQGALHVTFSDLNKKKPWILSKAFYFLNYYSVFFGRIRGNI